VHTDSLKNKHWKNVKA